MPLFIHCMYSRYPHQDFGQSNIKTDVDREIICWALNYYGERCLS